MNIRHQLETRIAAAVRAVVGLPNADALVAPAGRPEFGDYQANGIMAAAKALKTNPRQLAEKVVARLAGGAENDLSDLAAKLEVAGPGFINIHLRPEWLSEQVSSLLADARLGAEPPHPPQTVVVDYSAPNLAKEMHVGHLRSTIIGDCIVRVLEFLGHKVIRQNHVGDWGTQFGMLLAHMDDAAGHCEEQGAALADLEAFYRDAKARFDQDADFAAKARQYVVLLQSGDEHLGALWKKYVHVSLEHCQQVYDRLGVKLTGDDLRAESSYNDMLPGVVADLKVKGMIQESQGAMCVFLPEFTGRDGAPLPLIVQKRDEGYLYATTDLAAVRYRAGELHADRILYVIDARQSLHMRQVFAVARQAGFAPPSLAMEHVAFGTMNGPDGKPFKTRIGGTVKLMDLLDEAVQRAKDVVLAKSPELAGTPEAEKIARIVGIGAVKYSDLSTNRASDYIFSFDKMLALDGNTAPYLQYAYARIRSIFRKSGLTAAAGAITLTHPAERALGLKLLHFAETIEIVSAECLPNLLCSYLYDLAGAFTTFYENCPVLQSDEPVRASRLALCEAAANTLRTGLGLLGIQTLEQM